MKMDNFKIDPVIQMTVKRGVMWFSGRVATPPWPATPEYCTTWRPWKRPARCLPTLAESTQTSSRTCGGYWQCGCSRYANQSGRPKRKVYLTWLTWSTTDGSLAGVWGAEMWGGGVSAGGVLPGLLPKPLFHWKVQPAAFRGRLHVPGLQNERDCSSDCQQALYLHRQLSFSLRHLGNFFLFYKLHVLG